MDEEPMAQKEGITQVDIQLILPDSIAREAEASGLLRPESLAALLREEVRKRRIDRLFEAADRLTAVPLSPLTEAEVEEEVQAVRAARRIPNAGGR
jgi:hypothetical protein